MSQRSGKLDISPVSANSTATAVLRALQQENDTLRYQLLQTQQERDALADQLRAMTATEVAVYQRSYQQHKYDRASATNAQVQALQEKCRLLAERLLATVRDSQISQTSEAYFLLRTQQEERRFLMEALDTLLKELQPEEELQQQGEKRWHLYRDTDAASSTSTENVTTGTVCRLVLRVSDAFQARHARMKLDRAHAFLSLEQVSALTQEMRKALEQATRAIFNCATQLHLRHEEEEMEQQKQLSDGTEKEQDEYMMDAEDVIAQQRQQQQQPQLQQSGVSRSTPHYVRYGGSTNAKTASPHSGVSDSFIARPAAYSGGGSGRRSEVTGLQQWTVPHHQQQLQQQWHLQLPFLIEDLEWSCDVMKACHKGLADVHGLAVTASETIVLPSSAATVPAAAAAATATAGLTSTAHISPEVERLLASFLDDLRNLSTRGAKSQEQLARRLSHEVQSHYESAKQYEKRIQVLEAENARLVSAAALAASPATAAVGANINPAETSGGEVTAEFYVPPPPALYPSAVRAAEDAGCVAARVPLAVSQQQQQPYFSARGQTVRSPGTPAYYSGAAHPFNGSAAAAPGISISATPEKQQYNSTREAKRRSTTPLDAQQIVQQRGETSKPLQQQKWRSSQKHAREAAGGRDSKRDRHRTRSRRPHGGYSRGRARSSSSNNSIYDESDSCSADTLTYAHVSDTPDSSFSSHEARQRRDSRERRRQHREEVQRGSHSDPRPHKRTEQSEQQRGRERPQHQQGHSRQSPGDYQDKAAAATRVPGGNPARATGEVVRRERYTVQSLSSSDRSFLDMMAGTSPYRDPERGGGPSSASSGMGRPEGAPHHRDPRRATAVPHVELQGRQDVCTPKRSHASDAGRALFNGESVSEAGHASGSQERQPPPPPPPPGASHRAGLRSPAREAVMLSPKTGRQREGEISTLGGTQATPVSWRTIRDTALNGLPEERR